MLDVTSTELRPWEAKRLTAKQGYGLGLYFADITRSCLGFRNVLLVGMPQDKMGQLVEEGFVRESRDRVDGDLLATPGVTLGVSIRVFKVDSLDVQPLKSGLLVPSGNRGGLVFRALPLRPNKPMGLVGEMREGEFLFLL